MSRLTCTQCEGMLLDAADGLLLDEDKVHFDLHLGECADCNRMYEELRRGGAWMEMLKEVPPVPPDDLVARILARTSGDAAELSAMVARAAHAASLFGHSQSNVLPFRVPAAMQPQRSRLGRFAHTAMQPRFAMTAAMAFFSIALTLNIAGVRLGDLRASDLKPSNVRKSFWSANGRVVRYYDNLRVVYELESRVREMQRESDGDSESRRGVMSTPQPETQPQGKTPSGTPRSSAPQVDRSGPARSVEQPYRLVPVAQGSVKIAYQFPKGKGVQA